MTKAFVGDENGNVRKLRGVRVEWKNQNGKMKMEEIPGGEFELPADLVLLAMGYMHPTQNGMLSDLNLQLDARGNILADDKNYKTSAKNIFAAGDCRRGQSLVVWAIREGRQCAHAVDKFLTGKSDLPR